MQEAVQSRAALVQFHGLALLHQVYILLKNRRETYRAARLLNSNAVPAEQFCSVLSSLNRSLHPG